MDKIDKQITDKQIKQLLKRVSELEDFKSSTVDWSKQIKKWSTDLCETINQKASNNEKIIEEFREKIKALENETINIRRENRILNKKVKGLERENRELQERASNHERFLNSLSKSRK